MTLAFESAVQIATRIRKRELSAVECLAYFRQRIERFNPKINAIIVLDWERAQRRATAADRALACGESWGPLHGVPMTIKESYDLAGHATTWGDPIFKDVLASRDDLAVRRIESSGAIVFGKTNVPFYLMDFQTYNDIHGTTNNPWDLTRGPGGSSGGSAAALAAGLTSLELGSDIGGSIRNPSHYCGVYGHKPTYKLVGATRGAPAGNFTFADLAVHGPLARSAEDLNVSIRYLAGPNELESPFWRVTLPQPHKQLKDFRVVIWPSDSRVKVSAEISARCQALGERLARLGCVVSESARPAFEPSHSNAIYRSLLDAATNPSPEINHGKWRDLDNERIQVRMHWREFFKDWDVVIAPISATPAFKHDHSAMKGRTLQVDGETAPYFHQIFWAGLVNLGHLPSTCFPTGVGKEGLPIGLQAIGNAYDDLITIDFTRQLAREFGGFVAPPGYED
ncbi:MAG TPA: amidase family protein [Steroidobacteraceae bacterium]|nr:amidase family protein [Steroidobacteraceae bacterium]